LTEVFVSFSLLLLLLLLFVCLTVTVVVDVAPLSSLASHFPVTATSQLPAEMTSAESRSARQQSRSPGARANWSPGSRRRSQTAQRKQSTWKMRSTARMTRSQRSNGTEHAEHLAANRLKHDQQPTTASARSNLTQGRIAAAHGTVLVILYNWPPIPSKTPLLMGDLDPHLIHGSLGPRESATQTTSRSVQPF